jgi:putative colanic acid biosynthesis glycosyltransferase
MVINNGVDLNTFKPKENNIRSRYNLGSKFIILGVANVWNNRKGLNYFFKLASFLEADEVIILIGLTKAELTNLPKGIIGITKTNNVNELSNFYSEANVFVNPTLEDNFPTTNLEAIACGTPVVTFDSGGSAETIDETCGITVKKGDFGNLLESVRIIKRIGKKHYQFNARNRAERLYDKNYRFQDYIDLYNKLVS